MSWRGWSKSIALAIGSHPARARGTSETVR
jgi:hypothetical protein